MTPMRPAERYGAAMVEQPTAGAQQRSGLPAAALIIAAVLVVSGLLGVGWQELGLIGLAVLLLAWPALAFYAWARRRDDL